MKNNWINIKESKTNITFSILFFALFMADYFMTYLGINYFHIIEEVNPLLVSFFNLPFLTSLLLRLVLAFIIIGSLRILYIYEHKYYKHIMLFAIVAYGSVTIMHLRWIVFLFTY